MQIVSLFPFLVDKKLCFLWTSKSKKVTKKPSYQKVAKIATKCSQNSQVTKKVAKIATSTEK